MHSIWQRSKLWRRVERGIDKSILQRYQVQPAERSPSRWIKELFTYSRGNPSLSNIDWAESIHFSLHHSDVAMYVYSDCYIQT